MGKITVKHYLNKRVKPEYLDETPEKKGAEYYPVNYSITINRKTIHRQSKNFNVYSKDLFDNDLKLKETIKVETNLINRIIDIYSTDFEKNQINKDFKYLQKKKYNANDDVLNDLNSYIDYYTTHVFHIVCDYVDKEIEKFLKSKAESNFDLSMFEDYQKDIISIKINLIGINEAKFIYKNTNENIINLYVLRHLMYRGLGAYSKKYVYDYPLIDMINNRIIEFLSEFSQKRKEDYFILYDFKITDKLLNEYENILKYLTSWEYMNNKHIRF